MTTTPTAPIDEEGRKAFYEEMRVQTLFHADRLQGQPIPQFIPWDFDKALAAYESAKAKPVVDVERVADAMMEYLPSRAGYGFQIDDPTGHKWARAIALDCAQAAIAAITKPGDGERK